MRGEINGRGERVGQRNSEYTRKAQQEDGIFIPIMVPPRGVNNTDLRRPVSGHPDLDPDPRLIPYIM